MANMANSQVTDTVSQTALMTLGTAGSVAQALMAQGFVAALASSTQAAAAQQEATQVLADAALAAALKRMGQHSGSEASHGG
ncbi:MULTISPECIES: RebB family R body protein [unclassified Mameliella]|uniref:RebB family R body protein n=1 Tax=unclassified Mameliella TaxID=2630630 RepID=UPI00273E3AC8|nr:MULTISPECIES: RebB family R body protein [unclassified Mameliella]